MKAAPIVSSRKLIRRDVIYKADGGGTDELGLDLKFGVANALGALA